MLIFCHMQPCFESKWWWIWKMIGKRITIIFLPSLDTAKWYRYYCSNSSICKVQFQKIQIIFRSGWVNKWIRIYNFFYNLRMYPSTWNKCTWISDIEFRYLLLLCLSLLESVWTLFKTWTEGIWVIINHYARWQMPAELHNRQTATNKSWILSKRARSVLQCLSTCSAYEFP